MYEYLLNVTMAKKSIKITDDMIDAIKLACKEAGETLNSKRNGRKFSYVERVDPFTVKIKLESLTYVVATRAISSLTRALLRGDMKDDLDKLFYKGSIINATISHEAETSIENLPDYEIVQEVISIFFGQATANNRKKELARNTANKIRETIIEYKNSI